MSQASDAVRARFKAEDDIRDAGLSTPADVCRFDDEAYGSDPVWQKLDVYRPRGIAGSLPVIVSVHGGAWVYGDKQRYQYYCMSLAQRGFAVVNFSYRLAPEHKHPASLEDVCSVFRWVLDEENATRFGLDRENVFAVGDSAGAHLLGLFLGLCTVEEYAATFSFRPPQGFVPRAAALNCGRYHVEQLKDTQELEMAQLMADFLPGGGQEEELRAICVDRLVNGRFPPIFLMTSEGDFLREEAKLLTARLSEEGVPFEFHDYASGERLLGHVFHCDMRLVEGARCNDEECAFFRSHLRKETK